MHENKLTKDITGVKLAREVLLEEIQNVVECDLTAIIDCIDDLIDVTEMEVRIQKNREVQASMNERVA